MPSPGADGRFASSSNSSSNFGECLTTLVEDDEGGELLRPPDGLVRLPVVPVLRKLPVSLLIDLWKK